MKKDYKKSERKMSKFFSRRKIKKAATRSQTNTVTKLSHKLKNKNLLSIEKMIIEREKRFIIIIKK